MQGLPWLFSPALDLLAFAGSAVVALALLPIGWAFGWLETDTPEWTWVTAILLIDVAHVYATGFRVYFDRAEWRRRPWLYGLTPVLAFLIGGAIYSESVGLFWSLLAYLAVFHFVRQQYGWVALYRSREGDIGRWGRRIDASAIYLATIYPLVVWHANLPRHFVWFTDGDFWPLPQWAASVLQPLYWMALAAYLVRSVTRGLIAGQWNPGKDIVVTTTAVCWYVGIVALNSDYAFTVTNVIIHGVPYMVLIYWYRWRRSVKHHPPDPAARSGDGAPADHPAARANARSGWHTVLGFLAVIWFLAYVEELLWDCGLWHQRPWLFGCLGSSWNLGGLESWWAPMLAVPQVTHYVLDGFLWRQKTRTD